MGIFEKFKIGLNKSASSFSDGMKNLVIKKKIDEETLNKIEEFLIMSETRSTKICKYCAEEIIDLP